MGKGRLKPHLACGLPNKNLSEALQRLLARKHKYLRQATEGLREVKVAPLPEASQAPEPAPIRPAESGSTRAEQDRLARRVRRMSRYTEVIALHQPGVSMRTITKRLGMSRHTVRRFLRAGHFPERAPRPLRVGRSHPFAAHLQNRWDAGFPNAAALWRESRAQGFQGSCSAVRRFLQRGRPAAGRSLPSEKATAVGAPPSVRRRLGMRLRAEPERRPEEQAYCARLFELCPEIQAATDLAQQVTQIVRPRQVDRFDAGLEAASGSVTELGPFAAGLRQDQAAVVAALTMPWSNGQTEGQINRRKWIKRQMYGRAKFDLLRQRVLQRV